MKQNKKPLLTAKRGAFCGALLGAVGCSPAADVVDMDLSLVPSENISTVIFAEWTAPESGVGFIEYGLDGAFDLSSPPVQNDSDAQAATLLGLKAGFTYDFRAVLETPDGERIEGQTQTLDLEPPPAELERFTVTVAQDVPDDGFIITTLLQPADSWAVILDRDGDYVWFWPADEGLAYINAKPNPDGKSLSLNQGDGQQNDDLGGSHTLTLDGESLVYTRTPMSHHDAIQLPDDTLAFIALDIRPGMMGELETTIAGDAIYEVPIGSKTDEASVEKFNFFDDYRAPWIYCAHSTVEAYNTGALEWTHANSLMFLEEQNAYYLMSKILDGLWKIDRDSGEILWQLGGEYSDFTINNDDDWWSHGHMSHVWDDGMVIFDNGYHRDDLTSGIAEYAWNEETQTVERVFEYRDPGGRFVPMLGDARKLPSGNYMTSWSTLGILKEIDPDGETVWEATSALGQAITRIRYVPSLYDLNQ